MDPKVVGGEVSCGGGCPTLDETDRKMRAKREFFIKITQGTNKEEEIKEAMKADDGGPVVEESEDERHVRLMDESRARIAFYDQLLQEQETVNKDKVEAFMAVAKTQIEKHLPPPRMIKAIKELLEEDRRKKTSGEPGSAFASLFKEEFASKKRQIEDREGFSMVDVEEKISRLKAQIVNRKRHQDDLMGILELEDELIQRRFRRRRRRRESGSPTSSVASFASIVSSMSRSSTRVTIDEGTKMRLKYLDGKMEKAAKDIMELEGELAKEKKESGHLK